MTQTLSPTRRAALAGLLATTALAGCTSTTGATTPQSILSLVSTILNGLAGAARMPAVVAAVSAAPGGAAALNTVLNDIILAQGALASLTTNTPAATGATTVQQIDGWLNAIIDTADSPPLIGLIPSPFNMAITAVAILLPGLEAFVNQFLPAPAPATASAHAPSLRAKSAMTAAQAQAVLVSAAAGR